MQLMQERTLPSGLDFVICVTFLSLGLYRVTSSARFVWSAEGKPGSPCGQKKSHDENKTLRGKKTKRTKEEACSLIPYSAQFQEAERNASRDNVSHCFSCII